MNWLYKNKTYWRIAFLNLFSLAMSGPWTFDRISVPAPFSCSAPNVRLDEAFCGLPIPFTWIFSEIVRVLSTQGFSLPFFHSNPAMGIAFSLVLFLFLLPLFSTTLLLLRPGLRHGRMVYRVGLGLAGGLAGVYGVLSLLTDFSSARWMLWGVSLYFFTALGLLIPECLMANCIKISPSLLT